MPTLHQQHSHRALLVVKEAIVFVIHDRQPLTVLQESNPPHRAVLVGLERYHVTDGQPIEIRTGKTVACLLRLRNIADKHAVNLRLEILPSLGFPYRRLMQHLGTVVFPVCRILIVREAVHHDRVATFENAAQLVKAYGRDVIRCDWESEKALERLELVMR